MYIFSFLLWAVLSVAPIYGEDNFRLRQVNGNQFIEVPKGLPSKHVFVFIAPRCSSCMAQIKELSCLKSDHTFVALYGSDDELLREKIRLDLKENFYKGSQSFIESLPLNGRLSPQILVRDDSTQKLLHFVGLTECSKLKKILP